MSASQTKILRHDVLVAPRASMQDFMKAKRSANGGFSPLALPCHSSRQQPPVKGREASVEGG